MAKVNDYRFKNHADLTKITVFLLYVYLIVTVVLVLSFMYEFSLILNLKHGVAISNDIANAIDSRQTFLGRIRAISFFTTVIFFCLWLYRADNNALSFHPNETKNTPGWSVAWYFVPFVNLYAGLYSMHEIWKVSKRPSDWKEEQSRILINWWWFFWIIPNILIGIGSEIEKGKDIDSLYNALLFYIPGHIGQAICAFLLVLIIKEIYKMQIHTYKTLKAVAKNKGTYSDGSEVVKKEPLKIEVKKSDEISF